MTVKDALRQQIRQRRRLLTKQDREAAANDIATRLTNSQHIRHATKIAAYYAQKGEADVGELIRRLWETKKRVFLPVLSTLALNRMRFAPYQPNSRLKPNRFRIPEPSVPALQRLPAPQMDIVLVPLVAFDHKGHRLGMGGGFYDRTFAFRLHRRLWQKPLLIGVAYDFQEVPALAHEKWDVPLDMVVTPTRLIRFSTRETTHV